MNLLEKRALVLRTCSALLGLAVACGEGGPAAVDVSTADPAPAAVAGRPEWDGERAVERLGTSAARLRTVGGSRPLLAVEAGVDPVLELSGVAGGTLHLSALATSDDASRCQVLHRAGQAGTAAIDAFVVQGKDWVDARVDVPHGGGSLTLSCDGAMPLWSRPFFAPRSLQKPAPLVVLLSLDTLRADHVAGFGGDPDATRSLGRLGDLGVRYTSAWSQGTFTLSSHFAMLWSRLYGFPPVSGTVLRSLADVLSESGFATVAVTGGGLVGSRFHFDDGFDRFSEHRGKDGSSDFFVFSAIVHESIGWIDRLAEVPTFVFIHTYAVHDKPESELELVNWNKESAQPPDDVMEMLHAFYRKRIMATDRVLDRLFLRLHELSAKRPVLVIVTSDHGEAFGEHDNFRHGDSSDTTLHEEVIHVPLIVYSPGFAEAGVVRDFPTGLLDVAPSILDWAGIEPPASMAGSSLRASWSSDEFPSPRSIPSVAYTAGKWAIRAGNDKLILGPGPDGAVELYDLESDPGETTNLADQRPEAVALLRVALMKELIRLDVHDGPVLSGTPRCEFCAWRDFEAFWAQLEGKQSQAEEAGAFDDETLERLRALGYAE